VRGLRLPARPVNSSNSQPERIVGVMRSDATFNEEVLKRYEEWLVDLNANSMADGAVTEVTLCRYLSAIAVHVFGLQDGPDQLF
jgi:hypothetical protein